jgi:hypothetical protein
MVQALRTGSRRNATSLGSEQSLWRSNLPRRRLCGYRTCEARVYLKKFGITYPNGPDLATRISQYFRTKGVPETYFVDKNGVLQYVQIGPFSSIEQIRAQIDPLLK